MTMTGEPHDRSLGGGIGCCVHRALQSALRRHVDDAAAATGNHAGIDCLRHEEHALHVHREDAVEVRLGIRLEWLTDVHPRVVEQDVDGSELGLRLRGDALPAAMSDTSK